MAPLQPKSAHLGLILPLCTSSATLGLALFQYPIFMSFLTAPGTAGKPLSRFWNPFLKSGGAVIIATSLTTIVSGVLSARWLQTHLTLETTDVSKWYTYGAVLAVGHFGVLPLIAGPLRRMMDAGAEGSTKSDGEVDEINKREMQTWLMWHTVRTLLFDVPALWCFGEGAALSFWVA